MRRVLLALPVVAVGAGALAIGLPDLRVPTWSDEELSLVRSLALDALLPVPEDPSNRFADDPRAMELGRSIFFDTRFSLNG
jgi:cytochrome c peroxidase